MAKLGTASLIILCAGASSALAAEEQLFPKAYFGLALGRSTLGPQSPVKLDEDQDSGFKLLFGYDLSERTSLEFHAADLGETTFVGGGSLGYQTYGAEILYNLLASQGIDGLEYRQGALFYAKAGLGLMRNSVNKIDIQRDHDWHISFGAGVGLSLTDKTRLRLEYNAYDTDAHLLSLGLVRRFGSVPAWPFRNTAPPQVIQQIVQAPAPQPIQAPEPYPEPEPLAPSDVDGDGVDDSRDLCPATPTNRRVDESGCVFGGILDGVQFELDSAQLTLPATARLDAVIQDMQRYPKLKVQITAHTDNQGSAQYNLQLSIKRARSVAEYLIENGISPDRLRAVGAGESQPIYRNDNPSGRQGNRRVDFKVLNY